jgi:hypothetical protein
MPLLESMALENPNNETYDPELYQNYIQPVTPINMSFPALKNVDYLTIDHINKYVIHLGTSYHTVLSQHAVSLSLF